MYKSMTDRFKAAIDLALLENPLVPRQSENALWLLEQRYFAERYDGAAGGLRKERSFEEFARRVSRIVCTAESLYRKSDDIDWIRRLEKNLYADLVEGRVNFNSPCLFASGAGMTRNPELVELIYRSPDEMDLEDYRRLYDSKTDNQQLFACFVIDIPDSIEGIFESVRDAAVISKYGGGVGGNFGHLRERGADIKGGTGGKASGPVSFMETWNTMGSVVVQGGRRRAALMGMLPDDHPDIEHFMDAKVEEGKLSYFNISVCVSDELVAAAREKRAFALHSRSNGEVVRTVQGADLWNKLCQNAWRRGDPGVFFIDRANDDNLLKMSDEFRIESTNPCVTGDTWVMTDRGPRQVLSLVNVPASLLVDGKTYETTGFFPTGIKKVYELSTAEGQTLKLTADHKVCRISSLSRYAREVEWVEASALVKGDLLLLNDQRSVKGWEGRFSENEGYLMGLLLGDGTLKEDKAVLSVWQAGEASNGDCAGVNAVMDRAYQCALSLPHRADFAGWMPLPERNEYRLSIAAIKDAALSLGMAPGHKRITPKLESETSSAFCRGFLRGLFDADGSVQGSCEKGISVRLTQSDLDTLKAVQRMLGRFGIVSAIYQNRGNASVSLLPDGKGGRKLYETRSQHELVISNDNIKVFSDLIGFEDSDKQRRLDDALAGYKRMLNRERFAVCFEALTPCGEAEVFDVQVPGINAFDANGLYVHNCGEQPLPTYTSCNLGSINLAKFVKPDEAGTPGFDEAAFVDQVYRSIYYLDLVIDATSYPLARIGERTKRIRPVGLGLMGLADAAILCGDVYGSESFDRCCEKLGARMASAALMATADIVSDLSKEPFSESFAVAKLFEEEHRAHGGELFSRQWIEEMDLEAYRNFVAQMKSRRSVPYTLLNTLEALPEFLGADALPQLRRILLALLEGRLRNSRRLSIAPTGSISMIFDSSAGIEPNFAWNWSRKVMRSDGDGWEVREYFHPLVTKQGMEELHTGMKISDPRYVTAYDISTDEHVAVTGIFARYVDSGISKTVNLPNSATVDDVRRVYEACYDMGCKGITIYRDGSRNDQPIEVKKEAPSTVVKAEAEEKTKAETQPVKPEAKGAEAPAPTIYSSKVRQRSTPIVYGKTIKDKTPWGSLWVTLNYDGNDPFEVFASLGKSGSELKAMTEAISRVVSIGLRSGGHLEDFIGTLRGISGKEYWMFDCDDNEMVRSIPDAVALLLQKLIEPEQAKPGRSKSDKICPECGAPMEMVAGCAYCFSCGYSPCK